MMKIEEIECPEGKRECEECSLGRMLQEGSLKDNLRDQFGGSGYN